MGAIQLELGFDFLEEKKPVERHIVPLTEEEQSDYYIKKIQSGELELLMIDCSNWTPSVCLAAIQKNPNWIKHIENPSEELQLEAVKMDGKVLEYLLTASRRVCFEAVKQNPAALVHVSYLKAKEEGWLNELFMIAIQRDGMLYEAIRPLYSTKELDLMVFRESWESQDLTSFPSDLMEVLRCKIGLASNEIGRVRKILRGDSTEEMINRLVEHIESHPQDFYRIPNVLKTSRFSRLAVRLQENNWMDSPYHQLEGLVMNGYETFETEELVSED